MDHRWQQSYAKCHSDQILQIQAAPLRQPQDRLDNVLGYILEKLQDQVRPELNANFYQVKHEKFVQELAAFTVKYEKIYSTVVEMLETGYQSLFDLLQLP